MINGGSVFSPFFSWNVLGGSKCFFFLKLVVVFDGFFRFLVVLGFFWVLGVFLVVFGDAPRAKKNY